jgi:hypothetical protein
MHLKSRLVGIVILYCSITVSGQVYESINKEAADLFISLSNKDTGYREEIEKLKSVLLVDAKNQELELNYFSSLVSYDSLKDHFKSFEKELENIPLDSALVLFNQWYLHFSNTFYNYAEDKFFSSNKTKILLFSTSMSCYCTLEMSKNQTVELLKFVKEHNDEYDYWVVDTYENNELQLEYETLFAPSVIVFNTDNQILIKIEYDEMMIDKLNKSLINLN